MKKFLLAIAILLTSIGLNAQKKECNRLFLHQKDKDVVIYNMNKIDSLSFYNTDNLIIHKTNGTREEFTIDELDSLTFKNIEGRVAADINIIDHTINTIKFDITRTESCVGFKLMCLDFESISTLGDDDIIYYVDKNVSEVNYQDFEEVEIKDLNLDYETEYAIVTVGIDEYGLLCDVVKARFATPSENLVGSPDVEVEVIENNLYDFTLLFTPNSEVSKYSVLVAEEGTIEYQYAIFSYWNNMGDMIVDWGYEFSKKTTQDYTDQSPGTYYEVYIQAFDKNGNRAPYEVFKFKSKSYGGEGVAKVDIKLGDYIMSEWLNENSEWVMLPSQYFTFTPNDQTSAYRFNVVLVENYEKDADEYIEDLCSEPSMQTPGWYQYKTLSTDFQINPNTKCVAIAAAKNINDEWGPVTELYFKTPNKMPGEEDVTSITLNVDKNSIIANGKDVAKFTLTVNDTELTDGFQLVNVSENYEMNQKTFSTTTAGEYSFVATYDGLTSNVVVVDAVEVPENIVVKLVADKTKINDNGTDKATFTVYVNDIKTSDATIFNVTEGKDLEGNTFSSTNIGSYVFYATFNNIKSNNVTITVKETRVYAPGDLYEEDGVVGVVFRVSDDGTSGYIVSMDEAYLQWSTENVQANCFSGNGKYNTEDMLKLGADKYPAAKWCVDHGEGWYMPSSKELQWLWDAVSNGTHVYDKEFITLYNDKLDDPISEDYYWSSNETSEDLGEAVAFMGNSVVCLDPQKTSNFLVRAIYKF